MIMRVGDILQQMSGEGSGHDKLDRAHLEQRISTDVRAVNADANRLERFFSNMHQISLNDLDALRQIVVAELAGSPLSSGELRERLGVSAAAVTYLVDRMEEAGHISRASDQSDRRRVILRYSDHGMGVAQDFFGPLREHVHSAMAHLSDEQLAAGHLVLSAMREAMQAYHSELIARSNDA
jgi:MarR family transcriptional regulator, organic hydroperoxide resistance regulator